MIRNYLSIAVRSFLKHKSFTLLNTIGLTVGMVACLLILQYVKYERSYDTFHSKASQIYRLQYNNWRNGKLEFECAAAVPAAGPALKNNFPEVKAFARLYPVSGIASYVSPERGEITFREEKMQIADPSVFDVFDIPFIKGNQTEALKGPDKTVISERAAKKYFGTEDPIGKTITWDGTRRFDVTGIFKDLPENSHIKFDFLFSYETLNRETENNSEASWGWYDFNTYVLLAPGTNVPELQRKWDEWLAATREEEWKKFNAKQEFILQPILDIHLYSNLLQESQPEERGDGDSVYMLSIIALFILIMAWVNYINLATAKSFERANEVGVRKVMGAARSQLIRQFLAESFLVNLLAALLAVALVWLLWPYFTDLSGRAIPTAYLLHPDFWLLLLGLFSVGALLSGLYPAIVLSSFKPISVLKGSLIRGQHGDYMRKSLVVFQFFASVVLIVGSVVVYQQLRFMRNQDLGIDINKTLVIKGPGVIQDSLFEGAITGLRAGTQRIPGIVSMTASSNVPGDEIFWASSIRRLDRGEDSNLIGYTVGMDHQYVSSFGLKIVAGRNFDLDHPNERDNIILNEAMVTALDYQSPEESIGKQVRHLGDTFEIVGVLENYHQMSLKQAVTPLVYHYTPQFASFFAFKVESDNYQQTLADLQGPWQQFFPGNPLDYFFLDQFFNRQYEPDRKFGQVFGLFTMLAIFVSCLGLFGLASFMTLQRRKEIGIRKVMGSTESQIVVLLSKGFIQLVVVANLIAWPVAWYLSKFWLESFPYHIEVSPGLFILAAIVVIAIAFFSVALQTIRAAQLNPAVTLKNE